MITLVDLKKFDHLKWIDVDRRSSEQRYIQSTESVHQIYLEQSDPEKIFSRYIGYNKYIIKVIPLS